MSLLKFNLLFAIWICKCTVFSTLQPKPGFPTFNKCIVGVFAISHNSFRLYFKAWDVCNVWCHPLFSTQPLPLAIHALKRTVSSLGARYNWVGIFLSYRSLLSSLCSCVCSLLHTLQTHQALLCHRTLVLAALCLDLLPLNWHLIAYSRTGEPFALVERVTSVTSCFLTLFFLRALITTGEFISPMCLPTCTSPASSHQNKSCKKPGIQKIERCLT